MVCFCGVVFTGDVLFFFYILDISKSNEILEADSEDPLLIVDHEQPSAEETRLPNSHSAALVMAFIFLCVLVYSAYRFCKCKCGRPKQPLTVSLSGDGDVGVEGMDKYIKEREDYLAIYGKQNVSNTNSIAYKPDSKATSKAERNDGIVISVIQV